MGGGRSAQERGPLTAPPLPLRRRARPDRAQRPRVCTRSQRGRGRHARSDATCDAESGPKPRKQGGRF